MITYDLVMSKTEVKPITVEVVDLQDTETVSTASCTHIPPSGAALTILPAVDTPYLSMLFGPFTVQGIHTVKVQAVGSLGSKPEVLFTIDVKGV